MPTLRVNAGVPYARRFSTEIVDPIARSLV
jgi:hypothetical protein